MSDGLTVEFKMVNHNGVTEIATYRDDQTGEAVAGAAFIPDQGAVRLTAFPEHLGVIENLGTYKTGLAKGILRAHLRSRGYSRMRRV